MPWLVEKIADACAVNNFTKRTVQCYTVWARSFFKFCEQRDPRTWEAKDIEAFLTWMFVNQLAS